MVGVFFCGSHCVGPFLKRHESVGAGWLLLHLLPLPCRPELPMKEMWERVQCPTDNAALVDFLLSSDADVFVVAHRLSVRVGRAKTCKGVCAACACSNRASIFACRRCWLGRLWLLTTFCASTSLYPTGKTCTR